VKFTQEKMENKKSYHHSGAKNLAPFEMKSGDRRARGPEMDHTGGDKDRFTDRPRTRRDIDKICADWISRVGCASDARCAIVKGALATRRLSESEENEIIARANAGDNEAQHLLALSYSIPALRPILLRIEFDDDAADAFQNIMIKIIDVISRKIIKNAKGARVIITQLIHQELIRIKRERGRRPVEETLQDAMPICSEMTSPDERLNRAQEMDCVTDALTSLAPRERMTILARLNGTPYKEIGALLKISGERARQLEKHAVKAVQTIIARGATN